MGCKDCQAGNHDKCIEENKTKTTGCPGNCQHRVNGKVRTVAPQLDAEVARMMGFDQEHYTMIEISFMLKKSIRTVRALKDKPSLKHPGRKLLVAEKSGGIWRVKRADLIMYLQETYGGSQ